MNIWPPISHTTLKACKSGTLVESKFTRSLAIVCEYNAVHKGLISLKHGEVKFYPVRNPDVVEVFQYGEDVVLSLDHVNPYTSDGKKLRTTMGFIVCVKSGLYLNVHHVSDMVHPHLQFNFKNKILTNAHQSDEDEGLTFSNWKLVLVNPHNSHEKPVTLFTMQLP